MGADTMFELNKNIIKYQTELISNQSINESDVNELISHLQDEIDNLGKKGLSEEESFWIARHRLGDSKALTIEFSKVNPTFIWRKRLILLLLGYFLFTLMPKLVQLLTLPIYLLDLNWMLITSPVIGSNFPVPIPLFVFILLLIGGIFYFTSKQKIILNKNQNRFFNINPRLKIRYNFMIYLLGLYVITSLGSIFINFALHKYSPKIVGLVSASGEMFSLLWTPFLLISLILIMIPIFKRNKEKIIA